MDELKEKRYRQVQVWVPLHQAKKIFSRLGIDRCTIEDFKSEKVLAVCNLPERLAWLIEKKIGPNSIHALSTLYLYQLSKEEQSIGELKSVNLKPLNKLLKDFLKAFAVGKAGLHIDFELKENKAAA